MSDYLKGIEKASKVAEEKIYAAIKEFHESTGGFIGEIDAKPEYLGGEFSYERKLPDKIKMILHL